MKLTVAKRTRSICRVLLILMIFSLFVTGCGQNIDTNPDNDGGDPNTNVVTVLENGFKPSNDADETPIFYCAYRSDKTEFNINDVTLDFYYGGYYYQGAEYELENAHDFPSFELYFTDNEGNKFLVKRVEENFVSDKYSCDLIYDNDWNVINVDFNHSEAVTIPKEIFTEDVGLIYFSIYSENAKELESQTKVIAGIGIYYKVIGEQVVLSNQPFL